MKISVMLNEEDDEKLQALKNRFKNMPKTEIIRWSIRVFYYEQFAREQKKEGEKP